MSQALRIQKKGEQEAEKESIALKLGRISRVETSPQTRQSSAVAFWNINEVMNGELPKGASDRNVAEVQQKSGTKKNFVESVAQSFGYALA